MTDHNPNCKSRVAYGLFYGRSKAALAWAVPEPAYPAMWHIQYPDGRLSDFANLTRIKDAAAVICERGPPPRNSRQFHWEAVGEPPGVSPMRQNGQPAPQRSNPRMVERRPDPASKENADLQALCRPHHQAHHGY